MGLQERIKKNEEYFKGMEIINNTVIIKVVYGDKWGAYPSQDERIKVAKSEETPNEWFYYGDYSYTMIDEIFDLIEETIDMNLSAIERLQLFNQKMEELKDLFSNEPLGKLKTIKFVFEEEKKSKRNNKKKKTTVIEEPQVELVQEVASIVEDNNNNVEVNIIG